MSNTLHVLRADSFGHTQILGVFDAKENAKAFQIAYELNWDSEEKGYFPTFWINEVKYNPEPPSTDHLEIPCNV